MQQFKDYSHDYTFASVSGSDFPTSPMEFDTTTSFQGSPRDMNEFDMESSSLTTDDKRTRRLIRNREAARRNRLKKKDWIQNLQKANFTAKDTNLRLKERLKALEAELAHLEQRIMNGMDSAVGVLGMAANLAPSAE
ncbi:hypothetical protein HDU91_000702 [Kappamyces sp. JEL0680]|nr:hypothetical protein HDU91_000702 [Kappamyces sp. JEL0680]